MEYQNMSNTELKLEIKNMENEFEAEKRKIIEICEYLKTIEQRYLSAKRELDMRKNIYL